MGPPAEERPCSTAREREVADEERVSGVMGVAAREDALKR
jgi:hypothetical protein